MTNLASKDIDFRPDGDPSFNDGHYPVDKLDIVRTRACYVGRKQYKDSKGRWRLYLHCIARNSSYWSNEGRDDGKKMSDAAVNQRTDKFARDVNYAVFEEATSSHRHSNGQLRDQLKRMEVKSEASALHVMSLMERLAEAETMLDKLAYAGASLMTHYVGHGIVKTPMQRMSDVLAQLMKMRMDEKQEAKAAAETNQQGDNYNLAP